MATERQGRCLAADPDRLARRQSLPEERGVLVALSNNKRIVGQPFIYHVPSGLGTISQPANAKPLTLPYGGTSSLRARPAQRHRGIELVLASPADTDAENRGTGAHQ